jgi:hypothetical protein
MALLAATCAVRLPPPHRRIVASFRQRPTFSGHALQPYLPAGIVSSLQYAA